MIALSTLPVIISTLHVILRDGASDDKKWARTLVEQLSGRDGFRRWLRARSSSACEFLEREGVFFLHTVVWPFYALKGQGANSDQAFRPE